MALIIWSWYNKPMALLQKKFWFEIELLSKKCKNFFRGNAIAQNQMIRANVFFYYVYKMRNNALSVN